MSDADLLLRIRLEDDDDQHHRCERERGNDIQKRLHDMNGHVTPAFSPVKTLNGCMRIRS